MKKFFVIFSVLTIMALSTLTASAISGNGTEESPFLITNQEELLLVTDFPSSHFKLANDIVMSGSINTLCYDSEEQKFTGVFDGNGYTISNLYVQSTYATDAALFYRNCGTIKNLNLHISGMRATAKVGITPFNEGTISNCKVSGEIKDGAILSGITYTNSGIIEKCEVNMTLKNGNDVSGVACYNEKNAIISQCKVIGNYSSNYSNAEISGICVENKSKIEDCYFNGTLDGDTVAGISIGNYSSGSIKNCYAIADFGDATNIYPVGYKNTIENCYYDKTVSGLNSTTYGTPKSTTAMKMIQTYQTNWDFDTVWGIDSNINNGYPYLLWEYAPTDNQITFDTETQKAKIYLKEAGTYTVIFADYDGTMFNEADIQPLTLKQGYNSIPTTLTLTDGDKIFLWKDLKTLVPICEAVNVSSK